MPNAQTPQQVVGGMGIQLMMGMGIPGRVRLASEDSKSLLLISPNVISVSVVKPYPGWEIFSVHIREALDAFSSITTVPFAVERIGFRYINRVEAVGVAADVQKYFRVQPLTFPDIPMTLSNFMGRTEQFLHEDQSRLAIATFASVPSKPEESAFVLDLDVIAQNLDVGDADSVLEIVEQLRWTEKQLFEASITEDARVDLFGGYEEAL